MEHTSGRRFPANPKDYKLYEEVSEGVSATVYRALCIPFNEIVAIKVLDLEKCNNDFEGIRCEMQMMTLIDHPNVLRAHCSFTADRSLWVVMPFMAGGSCLHIMKSAYTEGFEEPVIAILLKEVLKALVYLHSHGHVHRDVKAGSILVDTNGAVKLADFGFSACMFDTGDRQRARNTFSGTPCWTAPEVMLQLHRYDFKADIWSFGITALELAHGHAPFAKYPPMKVALMTLQNAPPGLDYKRDKRFSKLFKDLVATCLVKDPKKRPSSEKLLKHSFFKRARSNEYLAKSILDGLSPLGDRFKKLKDKEADFQNKGMYDDKEHLSQKEYIKGISGWNFNLEDLKKQAALLDGDDGVFSNKDLGTIQKSQNGLSNGGSLPDFLSSETSNDANCAATVEEEVDQKNFEGSFASSFPSRPLQALKGYFDVCEDEASTSSPDGSNAMRLSPEHFSMPIQKQPSQIDDREIQSPEITSLPKDRIVATEQKNLSGSHMKDGAISLYRNVPDDINRSTRQLKHRSDRNYSGPLTSFSKRDPQCEQFANTHEETLEGRVIRQKGRFKITSEDPGSKGLSSANSSTNPVTGAPTNATGSASLSLPILQFILQQNAIQREQLSKLLRYMEQLSCRQSEPADVGSGDLAQFSPASSREQELLSYSLQLQQSITNLGEEVQKLKVHNAQLQQQLSAFSKKGKEPVLLDKQPQS